MKVDSYQACWIFAEELRPLLSDSDLAYARANWDRTVRQQVLRKLMLEQNALHELLEAGPDERRRTLSAMPDEVRVVTAFALCRLGLRAFALIDAMVSQGLDHDLAEREFFIRTARVSSEIFGDSFALWPFEDSPEGGA